MASEVTPPEANTEPTADAPVDATPTPSESTAAAESTAAVEVEPVGAEETPAAAEATDTGEPTAAGEPSNATAAVTEELAAAVEEAAVVEEVVAAVEEPATVVAEAAVVVEEPPSAAEPVADKPLDANSVLAFMRGPAGRPVDATALARELDLADSQGPALDRLLAKLTKKGRLIKTRENRYGLPEKMNLVVGTLSAHADGYGFVAHDGEGRDLFVTGRKLSGAMHGDRVVARIEHLRRSGKAEGRVIRVLERGRQTLVGRLTRGKNLTYVAPLDARLGDHVMISDEGIDESHFGHLVLAEITEYPRGMRGPMGRIVEHLGDPADPKLDVEVIIREFELPHEFPAAVIAEAEAVATEVSEAELEGREDYRELPIVTIDGTNAKDFDDAVYVEILPSGHYRLHVHIADVAHYVPVGSAIDREAELRTTSVYFPDRVLPMLPESLSDEVCSLKPGVDRLVQSALIDIDREGRTVNFEFHDGVIRSAERMTYADVAALLTESDGTKEERSELSERYADHTPQFRRMRELATILMEARRRRGSIDFDLPEPELVINLRGDVEDIVRSERNVAHRIIEEFMIRANEVVASHFVWESASTLLRVHEGPDPERVASFREFISGLDHSLEGGQRPTPQHFSRLLGRLAGRPEERVVSMLMLRTMKQARYEAHTASAAGKGDGGGHFGLASPRYGHFTSPIRRYPDLIVHRLLKADRDSSHVPDFDAAGLVARLETIALRSSQVERRAEKAEREYCGWKKVKFMADKVGSEYIGYITGVQSFGFFVELEEVFVEGLVPVSTLEDDYYRFDEPNHELRGEHTRRRFRLGDRVRINVAKVDEERRRVDFGLVEGPLAVDRPAAVSEDAPSTSAGRGRRGRRGRRGGRGGQKRGQRPTDAADKNAPAIAASAASPAAEGGAEQSSGAEQTTGSRSSRGSRSRGGRRRRGRGSSSSSPSAPAASSSAGESGEQASAAGGRKRPEPSTEESSSARSRSGRGGRGGREPSRSRGRGRSGGQAEADRSKATGADGSSARGRDSGGSAASSGSRGRGGSARSGRSSGSSRPGASGGASGAGAAPAPTASGSSRADGADKREVAKKGASEAAKPKTRKVNPYLTDIDP